MHRAQLGDFTDALAVVIAAFGDKTAKLLWSAIHKGLHTGDGKNVVKTKLARGLGYHLGAAGHRQPSPTLDRFLDAAANEYFDRKIREDEALIETLKAEIARLAIDRDST